jgi:uncharacterized protein
MLEKYQHSLASQGEIYLKVKIKPGAKQSDVVEMLQSAKGEIVKINIKSLPEKGRANNELIRFLSKKFDVSAKNVKIISGSQTKLKLVKISQ